jgi:hypothetical protein
VTEALGLLVLLERRDPRVRRDQREIRAMWVKLGKRGLLVKQDLQVLRDLLDRRGLKVPRVIMVATERRVKRAPRVKRVR